ncbi:MAG: hypothetical protein KFF77_10765 [Bacteroidetes bacterium]|nr:hypothetical protein [Bacteroidota bacterium]
MLNPFLDMPDALDHHKKMNIFGAGLNSKAGVECVSIETSRLRTGIEISFRIA